MSRNYTETETRDLLKAYKENPTYETVIKMAVKFRKTRKSVTAKLSKEGVYQKQHYMTKLGTTPRTKSEILAVLEECLGTKLLGLEKAQKPTLLKLEKSVVQLQKDFDMLLDEYEKQVTVIQMLKHKK